MMFLDLKEGKFLQNIDLPDLHILRVGNFIYQANQLGGI